MEAVYPFESLAAVYKITLCCNQENHIPPCFEFLQLMTIAAVTPDC